MPGAEFEPVASVDLQTTVFVARERVVEIARALRERPELRFEFLAELTAVDFWPREPRFELVYLLVSIEHRLRLRMKVRLPGADPHVGTVSGIGRPPTGSRGKSGTCSASPSTATPIRGGC